ncbi:hypothetical protein EDC96DRAFT_576272 [Choanephora cucurbitarum]|nr:hypothetical protein EDC96DRAFT_576272 [Choanephora cucurbitarum]
MNDKTLWPLDKAFIFDTVSNSWYEQNLTGSIIPSARTFHTAVKTEHQTIAVCGGQDGKASPFQTYLTQPIALLDVNTWSWKIPSTSSYQPLPRSHAVAGIVNNTKIIYGLGINDHTVYDDFYLFDLESDRWTSSLEEASVKSASRLEDWKIGLCFVGSAFVLMFALFFIYRSTRKNSQYFQMVYARLKKSVWSPRSGEPLWAEAVRLTFRILSFIIFSVVAAGLVIQVKRSPIIEQQHEEYGSNQTIALPDVRFCFDSWFRGQAPSIQCTTDRGESCNHYMINMTDTIQSDLNYYGTSRPSCTLFQPPFNFTPSYVDFHYTGLPTNDSVVHVGLYHPRHNPNIPVYNLSGSFDRWYNPDEKARFKLMEQMNLRTDNTYTITSYTGFTQIAYSIYERLVLPPDDLRSLFGLFGTPDHQQQFSVQSKVFMDQLIERSPVDTGTIQLFASNPSRVMVEEHRTFTLIQGLGILGGFIGLFVALLVNLFGFRPRSPFGIVHRWFLPKTQAALLKGLKETMLSSTSQQQLQEQQKQYNNEVNTHETTFYAVPIVQPVHERFLKTPVYHSKVNNKKDSCVASTDREIENQQQMTRMEKLENRLRIFDVLLKAYYIDDEVFQSLRNQRQSQW